VKKDPKTSFNFRGDLNSDLDFDFCQAQPKSQLSWAEVAVLSQFPTTQHPTPNTHRRG